MLERILSRELFQRFEKSSYWKRVELMAGSLFRLGYLERVVCEHIREWIRFSEYCSGRGIDLPRSFYDPEVKGYLRVRFPEGSQSRYRFIKASLRIFIEADEEGSFRRKICASPRPTTPLFREWVPSYLSFLRQHRGVSESTLRRNAFVLGELMEFLEGLKIHSLKDLSVKDLQEFLMTAGDRKPMTWALYMGNVRCFLRYAFLHGGMMRDLSFVVRRGKVVRHSGLREVLRDSELTQLLESIDRSTALGRRDYAILLLAARYGMRPSDIRQLRVEDIDWRQRKISFHQCKTRKPLVLPLLPEVSQALIDYLRKGRPSTSFRNIFVRHKAPFEPFSPENSLSKILSKALHKSGLNQRLGRGGLSLLRHSLATRMLKANIPIKTIGDILGHASTDSTLAYTQIDLFHLRKASLSMEEVFQ